jgi:hypothetical protein
MRHLKALFIGIPFVALFIALCYLIGRTVPISLYVMSVAMALFLAYVVGIILSQ